MSRYNPYILCPHCREPLDITPYADNPNLFEGQCPECEKVFKITLEVKS